MSLKQLSIWLIGIVAYLALVLWLPRLLWQKTCPPETLGDHALWQCAIDDASRVEAGEAVSDLFAINRGNADVVWDGGDPARVRVVSWMSGSKFDLVFPDGASGSIPEDVDVWVSPVPQLQRTCRSWVLEGGELERRLKQYLGLSVDWSYERLVEMWVHPEDLFRPCPDPEISDAACELAVNERGAHVKTPPGFSEWYEGMLEKSYGPQGAPWTRLGYTYDWGSPRSEVGASEYVVAPEADVECFAAMTVSDYCAPAPRAVPLPEATCPQVTSEGR